MALAKSFDSPFVMVSIDTGHANYAHGSTDGPPVDYFVHAAGNLLAHVHLQDTDGHADRHWKPGEGNISWVEVFRALARLDMQPAPYSRTPPQGGDPRRRRLSDRVGARAVTFRRLRHLPVTRRARPNIRRAPGAKVPRRGDKTSHVQRGFPCLSPSHPRGCRRDRVRRHSPSRFAIGQSDTRPSITIAVQKISNSNTLDVLREQSNVGERVFFTSLWEPLISKDWLGKLAPRPGLATEWKRIDDQTVELKLRQGVKFHNGEEMTAEDVVFSFGRERMLDRPKPRTARRSRPLNRSRRRAPERSCRRKSWRRPPRLARSAARGSGRSLHRAFFQCERRM